MFAFIAKLLRRQPPASPPLARREPAAGPYTLASPIWSDGNRHGVYRGLSSSEAIALVKNLDQALTLRDTLNLANGGKPSRKLLDAIYREAARPLASDITPRP